MTPAYAALQRQVTLLTNGRALSALNLRLLEIALDGMGIYGDRRRDLIQTAIQVGRDKTIERRQREEARRETA